MTLSTSRTLYSILPFGYRVWFPRWLSFHQTFGSREKAVRRRANAEPGALHDAVRSRARIRLEQVPAWCRYPDDFCRAYPPPFHEMDLGSGIFSGRMGVSVSRPPHRGKPSGVFPGTDLFAGWANLGRKRSMDVSDGNAPQAGLVRYSAK